MASGVSMKGNLARQEVTLGRHWASVIGAWFNGSDALGGLSVSAHHAFDPNASILYLGDGSRRTGKNIGYTFRKVAGEVADRAAAGDGGDADKAFIGVPEGLAVGPDGSVYWADTATQRVRKIGPDGVVTTVAGVLTQDARYNGDDQPATLATLSSPSGVAVGSDGSLYIADAGNYRVRRVRPDGVITTVAGNGDPGVAVVDGAAATAGALGGRLTAIALDKDGSLYLATQARVRKVSPDGLITTVAGNGVQGFAGDGGPATQAQFSAIVGLAVAAEGSLYIADAAAPYGYGIPPSNRVRRVETNGIVITIAGTGGADQPGDGGPATSAQIGTPSALAAGPDGSIYVASRAASAAASPLIRRIAPDGVITTVVGNRADRPAACATSHCGLNGPATAAWLIGPKALALAPDGSLLMADVGSNPGTHLIGRVNAALPGVTAWNIAVASDDGSEVYVFDQQGRHLATQDALLGIVRLQFDYDRAGRLTSITDVDQQVTQIHRDPSGVPTGIVAPTQQTTQLQLDQEGYLGKVTDPALETVTLSYYPGSGLLQSLEDPLHRVHSFDFEPDGRLKKDTDPANGFKQLDRSDTPGGHRVTITTAMGRVEAHEVATLANGDRQRTHTGWDGRFDRASRSVVTTTPTGRHLAVTLTPEGRVHSVEAPGILPVQMDYWPDGRPHTVTQGDRSWVYTYEDNGWLATITDPLLQTSTFHHDLDGRVQEAIRPDLEVIGASYYPGGNVKTVTPPGRPDHTFTYKPNDLVETYVAPDVGGIARTTSWSPDLDGLLLTWTRPGEPDTLFDPDPITGRLQHVTLPLGMGTIDYGYHPTTGKLQSLSGPAGISVAFGYDGALLTSRTWSGSGFERGPAIVASTYNNDFRLDTETVNGGAPVSFGYDNDGFRTHAGGMTLTWDPQNGLYTGSTIGVVTETVTPDAYGGVETEAVQAGGATLFKVTYKPDAAGRIFQRTETVLGETHTFEYHDDPAGRLRDVLKDGVLAAHYEIDANGNRQARTSSQGVESGGYDDQDRLGSYGTKTYVTSPAGDRTSVIDTATGARRRIATTPWGLCGM